jgi:hypothetical protein
VSWRDSAAAAASSPSPARRRVLVFADAQGQQLRVLTVAKSPAAPNLSLAYRVTAAGLEWLQGVTPPPAQPGSVVDQVISNYQAYEGAGFAAG